MPDHRMTLEPMLLFTLWLVAYPLCHATGVYLPSNITNAIPSCAQSCFKSFVLANFEPEVCGTYPSLECLCRKTGRSGFTVGEGGVQCIIAESNRKSCRGPDASEEAVSKAYSLCSDVASAAPETHPTIVATLLVPSGTGPVVVPTAPMTTHLEMSSIPTPPSLSSAPTSAPASTPTSTSLLPSSSVPASGSNTGTSSDPDSNPPRLNAAQIAGVTLGVVAAVGLAAALILIAKCLRRKRFGDDEQGFFKPRNSPASGTLRSNQSSPHLQISAPIRKTPVEMDFKRPGDRGSITPSTIGLALSPPGSMVSSRIIHDGHPALAVAPSTPKPTLTLTIPKEQGTSRQHKQKPLADRESVLTEFAEDGEMDSTSGTQIWRPPPSDPQSATTIYVADKWGNWVLSNQKNRKSASANNLDVPDPTSMAGRGKTTDPRPQLIVAGSREPAVSKEKQGPPELGSPIVFRDSLATGGIAASPSIYSSAPQSVALSRADLPSQPLPAADTYLNLIREQNAARPKSQRQRRKSRHTSRAEGRRSFDSTTTIESSSSGPLNEDDSIANNNKPQEILSPVAESPSPNAPISPGKSPVSYPTIPGFERPGRKQPARRDDEVFNLIPPPLRTNFYSPPGQPSPTLGAAELAKKRKKIPATNTASDRQLTRPPSLGYTRRGDPRQFRTGSPEARSSSAPPERQEERQGKQGEQGEQAGGELPLDPGDPSGSRVMLPEIVPPSNTSSFNSNASSLLAKRVGADRAAALALTASEGASLEKSRPNKWQRAENPGPQQPGGPGFVVDGMGHVPLPVTPSWQPKLTPTRRGDDLFLSVQ